jgi:hypothetical protein
MIPCCVVESVNNNSKTEIFLIFQKIAAKFKI